MSGDITGVVGGIVFTVTATVEGGRKEGRGEEGRRWQAGSLGSLCRQASLFSAVAAGGVAWCKMLPPHSCTVPGLHPLLHPTPVRRPQSSKPPTPLPRLSMNHQTRVYIHHSPFQKDMERASKEVSFCFSFLQDYNRHTGCIISSIDIYILLYTYTYI